MCEPSAAHSAVGKRPTEISMQGDCSKAPVQKKSKGFSILAINNCCVDRVLQNVFFTPSHYIQSLMDIFQD